MNQYPVRRFLDEFGVGDTFETPSYALTERAVSEFARAFDPQAFHLDAEEAERGPFGRIVASGWQTAAITMRLVVESGVMRGTGILGTGIDGLRWHAPVEAGARLTVRGEIVEIVERAGKRYGRLRVRLRTADQTGTVVMSQVANLSIPQRPRGTQTDTTTVDRP